MPPSSHSHFAPRSRNTGAGRWSRRCPPPIGRRRDHRYRQLNSLPGPPRSKLACFVPQTSPTALAPFSASSTTPSARSVTSRAVSFLRSDETALSFSPQTPKGYQRYESGRADERRQVRLRPLSRRNQMQISCRRSPSLRRRAGTGRQQRPDVRLLADGAVHAADRRKIGGIEDSRGAATRERFSAPSSRKAKSRTTTGRRAGRRRVAFCHGGEKCRGRRAVSARGDGIARRCLAVRRPHRATTRRSSKVTREGRRRSAGWLNSPEVAEGCVRRRATRGRAIERADYGATCAAGVRRHAWHERPLVRDRIVLAGRTLDFASVPD